MNFTKIFQVISYLQYPLMVMALFFSFKPYFNGFDYMSENLEAVLKDYSYVLIFMGLGISFSTLQDTTKTQNSFSQRIWENPKKGKIVILVISFLTISVLSYGIFGYFITDNEMLKDLSFGTIVLGIGLIGFLKTALEVFENQRKDKKSIGNQ